jgi:hypothetical protein
MNTPTPTPTPRTDAAKITSGFAAVPYGFQDFARTLETELATITAERDQLRTEVERLESGLINQDLLDDRNEAIARAERAEAAETVALANWNGALERAMKAEADLIATERDKAERYRLATLKLDAQIADWSILKLWGGTPEIIHDFIKGQQARIHHCQDIDAELAMERARLDWVFRNCKVTADDFTTGNRDVYAIHDREALGAAMKEDRKDVTTFVRNHK